MYRDQYGQIHFDSSEEALAYARGDSAKGESRDGLIMTERLNDAGAKIRTFECAPGTKKTWMNDFRAPVNHQLCISNNPEWSREVADKKVEELRAAGLNPVRVR